MFVEQVAYYFQVLCIRQCLFVIGKLDYISSKHRKVGFPLVRWLRMTPLVSCVGKQRQNNDFRRR